MKIFIIIAMMFLCASQAMAKEKQELNLKNADLLIDVRTPEEFVRGHLDGAINIPYLKLSSEILSVAKGKEDVIYVYCRSGRRSEVAKGILTSIGYDNTTNIGGYLELLSLQK